MTYYHFIEYTGTIAEESWGYFTCEECKWESETYPLEELVNYNNPIGTSHDHPITLVRFEIYYPHCTEDNVMAEDGIFDYAEALAYLAQHELEFHAKAKQPI